MQDSTPLPAGPGHSGSRTAWQLSLIHILTAEQVECMGIDNQGETVVVWDKVTGEPLYPAIVWQDRRTATWIEELEEDIQYMIRQKTGLHADAYFGATKIKWILDNVEGAKKAAMEGRLLAGPTDSWFIWNLTDRKVFATDYSTASRTALFNIQMCIRDRRETLATVVIAERKQ